MVSGALIVLSILPYNEAKAKYDSLNSQVNSLMPIVEVYNQYMDEQALYNEVSNLYQLTNTRNEGLSNFIAELEANLPSLTNVTSFSSDGTTVNMAFKCSSKQDAVNLINNLRTFDSIASMSVSAISDAFNADTLTSEVSFSVTCTYKAPDPVSINMINNNSYGAVAVTETTFDLTPEQPDGEQAETAEEVAQ